MVYLGVQKKSALNSCNWIIQCLLYYKQQAEDADIILLDLPCKLNDLLFQRQNKNEFLSMETNSIMSLRYTWSTSMGRC